MSSEQPSWMEPLSKLCIVRGIYVGSRVLFEEMNKAIEANNIHPVLDDKVFALEEAKEAYQYMWDRNHVGKVCIKID
jgi:NADPH:quinone reductase-like Zn-dependent oxidoreductase